MPDAGPGPDADVALEIWAIVVVASVGGSFAAFFVGGDRA